MEINNQNDTINSTVTENEPSYFHWEPPIKILVVCSSPQGKNFPKQKNVVQQFFPDPIEVSFLDGSKYKNFPDDLIKPDFSIDVIWFCGCNLLQFIFPEHKQPVWLNALKNKLKSNGIVFFTETEKIQKKYRCPNPKNIFIDINCYKNHPNTKLGFEPERAIASFLNFFDENRDGDFIYYTKKETNSLNTLHNTEEGPHFNNHQWENNAENYRDLPQNINPPKWWQFWKGGRQSRKKKHRRKKRRKTRKKRGGLPEFVQDEFTNDEESNEWVAVDDEIWNHLRTVESLQTFAVKLRWWPFIDAFPPGDPEGSWWEPMPGWNATEVVRDEPYEDENGDIIDFAHVYNCSRCNRALPEAEGKDWALAYSCPDTCFQPDELETYLLEQDADGMIGRGPKITLKRSQLPNLQILVKKPKPKRPKSAMKTSRKSKKKKRAVSLPLTVLGVQNGGRRKTRKQCGGKLYKMIFKTMNGAEIKLIFASRPVMDRSAITRGTTVKELFEIIAKHLNVLHKEKRLPFPVPTGGDTLTLITKIADIPTPVTLGQIEITRHDGYRAVGKVNDHIEGRGLDLLKGKTIVYIGDPNVGGGRRRKKRKKRGGRIYRNVEDEFRVGDVVKFSDAGIQDFVEEGRFHPRILNALPHLKGKILRVLDDGVVVRWDPAPKINQEIHENIRGRRILVEITFRDSIAGARPTTSIKPIPAAPMPGGRKRKKRTRRRKRSAGMKPNSGAPVQQKMARGENKRNNNAEQNNNASSVIVDNKAEQKSPWNAADAKRDLFKEMKTAHDEHGNKTLRYWAMRGGSR